MQLITPLAYIDPGTGSLIFQILAAALMSVLLAFESVRMLAYNLIRRVMGKPPVSLDEDADDEDADDEDAEGSPRPKSLNRSDPVDEAGDSTVREAFASDKDDGSITNDPAADAGSDVVANVDK